MTIQQARSVSPIRIDTRKMSACRENLNNEEKPNEKTRLHWLLFKLSQSREGRQSQKYQDVSNELKNLNNMPAKIDINQLSSYK
jgi:hypothetical protein